MIQGVPYEIEECGYDRIAEPFGGLFGALGRMI
jgi:hypothetical protein